MKKIDYPVDIRKFKKDYLSIFNLQELQERWMAVRNSIPILQNVFPKKITRILTADYGKLVAYYKSFVSNSFTNDQLEGLKAIFNYDMLQPSIADFFMGHADELKISSCYYCETSYINMYSISDDGEGLYYVNSASKRVLKSKLKIQSDKSLSKIIARRPFSSAEEFNNFGVSNHLWRVHDKFQRSFHHKDTSLNHFDLDHVLDKGSCPIVALSLMNFVPSCSVCNEKIKRDKVIGDYANNKPVECLSPTSNYFSFDANVSIEITPVASSTSLDPAFALDNIKYYSLDFKVKDVRYEHFVRLFRLRDRYRFHMAEGLYWLVMKNKYNDSAIEMMATTLADPAFSIDRIKEDIFREQYDEIRNPCFNKMKSDILKS